MNSHWGSLIELLVVMIGPYWKMETKFSDTRNRLNLKQCINGHWIGFFFHFLCGSEKFGNFIEHLLTIGIAIKR